MCRNIKILFLVTTITFLITLSQAIAIDEAELVKSAENLLDKWVSVLSNGVIDYTQGSDGLWRATKTVIIKGSEDFKIEKTGLAAPTHNLFIRFKSRFLGGNSYSPHASQSPKEGMAPGFPTLEDSQRHLNDSDFGGNTYDVEHNIRYAFVIDKWVLRDTDKYIFPIDYATLTGNDMFKNLLSVPIEDLK
jgi:hypothetical protein